MSKKLVEILFIVSDCLHKIGLVYQDQDEPVGTVSDDPTLTKGPDTECTGCAVKTDGRPEPEPSPEPEPTLPPSPPVNPTVASTPPSPSGVELDVEGFPWDSRIHSGGKTKYAKKTPNGVEGAWKLARGVDKATVEQVKAQLRQQYPDPATPTATAPPASAPAPEPPPAPATPPVSPGPAVSAPAQYGTYTTWGALMREITGRQMPPETVVAACQAYLGPNGERVADVAALQNVPAAIPFVAAQLGLTAPVPVQ